MSTFNGWEIVAMPATPVPRTIEWELNDVIGTAVSPFSLQTQIYDWGQSILRASISMPAMNRAQALPWATFFAALRGRANVFLFGDPLYLGPQAGGAVAGTVTGSGQTGFTLLTSSSGLLPGDWFSLGLRLYRVISATGGTLGIWPPLRESPADGTDLVLMDTQGLFRLTKNARKFHVDEVQTFGFDFEIEEAL